MTKKRSTNTPDISIIVNAHNENTLLHRTLKSIQQNIDKTHEINVNCEVIIVADKVDDFTKDYIENRSNTALTSLKPIVEYVNYGDLGESRNHGIKLARGEYVANFDGDDIWCDRWLAEAYAFIQDKERVVLHPQVVVSFGAKHNIWHVKSSTDPDFDPRSCVEDNWWTSCMFTRRSTFDEVKYRATLRARGFSFEDWLWNSETLARGIEHIVVPGTSWFYRRKPTSMLTEQMGGITLDNALMTPSGVRKYNELRSQTKSNKTTPARVTPSSVPRQIKTESIVANSGRIKVVTIRAARKSGKIALKAGKKYVKPRLERHHRVHRFTKAIVAASRDLLYSPAVSPAHSKVTGPNTYNGVYVPEWVIEDWRTLNSIDPGLFPARRRLYSLHARQLMTMGPEQAAYWKLAEQIGEHADYVIMTPWLKTSGASLVVLRYANAYIESHPTASVVVVATEDVECPWESRLDERIKFVKVDQSFTLLPKPVQSKVIAKLTVQLKPKKLHIIHSQEAYRAVNLYAPQMTLHTKLYFSAFAYDYSPEGMRQSGFLMNAEPALPYTTQVFTDNQWIIDDTVDTFGVPRDLFTVHKLPFDEQDEEVLAPIGKEEKDSVSATIRVLWASRIAKAKRPDILYEILKKAHTKKLNIEFTLYGELYGNTVSPKLLDKICKLPNVKYMGGFTKGVVNIPGAAGYDAFLFTSEGEGMPNAIIEAQSIGLPVIASAVGGVPETVIADKTGIPVTPYDNIDGYVAALEHLMKDRGKGKRLGQAAKRMIKKERSWQAFVDTIKTDL